jgi:hypothetical protein
MNSEATPATTERALNPPALGQPLARRRTADVYAWDAGQVLKLFHAGFDQASIEAEARLGRRV